MSLLLALGVLLMLSAFAFWKFNPVLFMLAGGVSMVLGLYWYDIYTTNQGLGISLMLILYSLACISFAYMCIFWTPRGRNGN